MWWWILLPGTRCALPPHSLITYAHNVTLCVYLRCAGGCSGGSGGRSGGRGSRCCCGRAGGGW